MPERCGQIPASRAVEPASLRQVPGSLGVTRDTEFEKKEAGRATPRELELFAVVAEGRTGLELGGRGE